MQISTGRQRTLSLLASMFAVIRAPFTVNRWPKRTLEERQAMRDRGEHSPRFVHFSRNGFPSATLGPVVARSSYNARRRAAGKR